MVFELKVICRLRRTLKSVSAVLCTNVAYFVLNQNRKSYVKIDLQVKFKSLNVK